MTPEQEFDVARQAYEQAFKKYVAEMKLYMQRVGAEASRPKIVAALDRMSPIFMPIAERER